MPYHALSYPLLHTDKDAESAVVLDLNYAEHFDIVSPGTVYKRLLGRTPRVFVGSAKELVWSTVELAEHLAQHYQRRVRSQLMDNCQIALLCFLCDTNSLAHESLD